MKSPRIKYYVEYEINAEHDTESITLFAHGPQMVRDILDSYIVVKIEEIEMKHVTVLDVENTTLKRNGKLMLDPFEAENSLTMVGMLCQGPSGSEQKIITFDHSEQQPTTEGGRIVQNILDDTHLLVMHNAAHDLIWLWESGFTYTGEVFDTMLGAYILQRGQKEPLSLDYLAERYNCDTQKMGTLKDYFNKGYTTREIPHDELSEYLSADLHATMDLFKKIDCKLSGEDTGLVETVKLTNRIAD